MEHTEKYFIQDLRIFADPHPRPLPDGGGVTRCLSPSERGAGLLSSLKIPVIASAVQRSNPLSLGRLLRRSAPRNDRELNSPAQAGARVRVPRGLIARPAPAFDIPARPKPALTPATQTLPELNAVSIRARGEHCKFFHVECFAAPGNVS